MEIKQLASSFIQSASYEPGKIGIKFSNGKEFIYEVPGREHFDGISSAESAGSYYSKNIKGKFNLYDPLAGPPPIQGRVINDPLLEAQIAGRVDRKDKSADDLPI